MQEILEKVLSGEIKLYELDSILGDSNEACEIRRKYVEAKFGVKLENVGKHTIDFNELVGRNIENPIGAVQVPVGIAGPLRVEGDHAKGEFPIFLATTEGALVASVNRGCSVINASGGARAKVIKNVMTRAPVFRARDLDHALEVVSWVRNNFETIKEEAESTTRHGKLLRIEPFVVGRNVFLRFMMSTGDAMGMNMVTIATDKACRLIESETGAKLISLSGNVCVDKKPAKLNAILGRGKYVISEVRIPSEIVKSKLKCEPNQIVEVNMRKNMIGSWFSGSLGFNAHHANIIAAMFIALGQDCAHVVDGSLGITTVELLDDELYVSVTLPSLNVGTVGGGTRAPCQQELLKAMGVYGSGTPVGVNALKLAEIVASAVLAGEISLLGALAAQHLARAHELLGRGKIKEKKQEKKA